MKTTLEEELGGAFAARAASLPPEAVARVRSMDYRPRAHRRALPVGLSAAAGAATVGTVLAVALGGAAPAYAGWSATPASSAAPSSAAPDCVSTLSSAPAGPSATSSGSDSGTGTGTGAGAGAWQTLLTDVRGPFTITLLQNGTSYATCFNGPSFTEVNRITPPASGWGGVSTGTLSVSSQTAAGDGSGAPGGAGSLVSLEGTSSGDLTQVLQNHLTTLADGPYTFIDGRVANGATAVTLVLKDGQDIVTTVADGWFVAWWPGSTDAMSALVTKSSGTMSEPFVPVSQMGTKFPLGQAGSTTGIPVPPPPTLGGTCAAAPSTTSGSSGPSGNCKYTAGAGGPSVSGNSGSTGSSGNTGNSGNIAQPGKSAGNTGGTGSGPTTKPNP